MKNKPKFLTWALPIILAFISFGCGLSSLTGGANTPTPTRRIEMLPTFTPTAELVFVEPTPIPEIETPAENTNPEQPAESEAANPQPTLPPESEPTEEPTPEPEGPVTVTVKQNMNVRNGPGTIYNIIGAAPAGASSVVMGRNADNSWLQVQYPPGSTDIGWVYAELVDVNKNLEAVPVAQAPPIPPTPVPLPTPVPQPTAVQYQFTPTAWSASENKGICHFRGTIRDPGGNAVSGYSVLVDNGAYSVMSHPTSASPWYPETVDGQWDVSGIPLKDCIGWWWLTVVRYECDFNAKFDGQCKQFTRLSEDVKIRVDYPNHTVTWADWSCHWDCDKGIYNVPYRK